MQLYLRALTCFYGRLLIKNRDDFTRALLLLSTVKLFIIHHNVWVHNGTEKFYVNDGPPTAREMYGKLWCSCRYYNKRQALQQNTDA